MNTSKQAPPPSSTVPRRVRAVVFSNFPGQFFQKTLVPKFEDHNIEIVRTIKPDRSGSTDVSGADVVIAMVDLMASGQRAYAKEIAKKNGLRFIGLTRSCNWSTFLSNVKPTAAAPTEQKAVTLFGKPTVVSIVKSPEPPKEEAPVSEQPDAPAPTIEELETWISLYRDENEALTERGDKLEATLKTREDHILKLLEDGGKLKTNAEQLDKRLRDQLTERSRLERELTEEKKFSAGLESQLATKKAEIEKIRRELEIAVANSRNAKPGSQVDGPALVKTIEMAPAGSVAAYKASNTRMRNELEALKTDHAEFLKEHEKLREAHAETHAELERVNAELDRLRLGGNSYHANELLKARETITQWENNYKALAEELATIKGQKPSNGIDKTSLVEWIGCIKSMMSGDSSAYRTLLLLAEKYNMDLPTVLSIIK